MARSKYRKTRRQKSRYIKTRRNKKHIKKQFGGELSNNCIREILKMAFKENQDLTEPQINVLVDKIMTVSTLWRNYTVLMNLLNQIDELVNEQLNYDECVDWSNDIVEHLINEQEIN
jgi:hypothetical protein